MTPSPSEPSAASLQGASTPPLSAQLINDVRDTPFLWLMVRCGLWALGAPLVLFLHYRWWMTPLYVAVTMAYFFPPFTLMLHCSSHRPLFRKRFEWMNNIIPWVLCPFFGQTPGTYFAHHIGMHHPENNMWEDHSTTLPFQRDSLVGFLRYFLRFMTVGIYELTTYLWRTRRHKLAKRALVGEVLYWLVVGALLFVHAPAALTVFVAPVVLGRFGMMAGNWAQHAFIDAASPDNAYRNSITCTETFYNERCFNDGYHIGHHLQARMHWTEMPGEFERNRARYAEERAIVFRGVDYFAIWALLMLKAHRRLARQVVPLGAATATEEQVVRLFQERLRPVPRPSA